MGNILNTSEEKFEINATAELHLIGIAKWAKFIAIVGFVSIALFITLAIFFGLVLPSLNENEISQSLSRESASQFLNTGMFLALTYSITALITFFPALFLYKFATKAQQALKERNNMLIEKSLNHLRLHYKFIGILTLILIVFYAITFGLTTASSLLN